MKRRTAEQFSWFKFAQITGLTKQSKKIIYEAIHSKVISIEQLFFLEKAEFASIFPAFGKGEYSSIFLEKFQEQNTPSVRNNFNSIKKEIHLIPITDKNYPSKIKQRLQFDAPPIFYGIGHLSLANNPTIALLGSEEVDPVEIRLTWQLGSHFARQGYNVLSNHTWGTSEHAHKSALSADGTITGMLAKGLNDFVVRQNIRAFGWEINSLFLSPFSPYLSSDEKKEEQSAKLLALWADAVVIVNSNFQNEKNSAANQNIETALFALQNNIPTFAPKTELLSKISLSNMGILKAGAHEFSHPRFITKFLNKNK